MRRSILASRASKRSIKRTMSCWTSSFRAYFSAIFNWRSASTKARHAEVVAMNSVHSNVTATLSDFYAADYVDKLDELKVNIDERNIVAQNAAYALGRKTDSIITDTFDAGATALANNSAGTTLV